MKKNIFLPAFLFSLLTFGYAHAESIVMKNTVYGLEALSDEDIQTHGQVVSDILLKYCWPMCQDSDLTPEEQHELLSPEGNEERFLEKKLNETVPASERDFEFAVVFVPTTLYELFCIAEQRKLTKIAYDLIEITNLYNYFSFFSETDKKNFSTSLVLTSYRLFIEFLTKEASCDNNYSKALSNKIELSKFITSNLSKLILQICSNIIRADSRLDKDTSIILNYIKTEYKAHSSNKGLISRETSLINQNMLASTQNGAIPYSISFGASLLAGFINDPGACVYNCHCEYFNAGNRFGYALFIDKTKYFHDKVDNLFLIRAMPTLANLFAVGAYFHPRSKAATQESLINPILVKGIYDQTYVFDKTAQGLLIERDSLEHELKFLKYFIDNFEIFYLTSAALTSTEEEKKAEILHAQCEAFVETYALIKERQEQLARVLDAIAEVAAKEKDQKNENFGALLASTPETADLVAEDRAQQRIATLARHLAPATQYLTSAKL